jgi:DNA-binding transcriptional LysR family regulator
MRLELMPADTLPQLKLIEDGELDGGFAYPVGGVPVNLASQPVRSGNVVIAFPSGWSNRIATEFSLSDFAAFPFVGFPREDCPAHYDRILAVCNAAGFSPHFVQQGHTESSILSLVSAGIGVAIVNDANVARPPALVRFARVRDLSVPLDLHFVYRSDNLNPALGVFIDTLKTCLASRASSDPD